MASKMNEEMAGLISELAAPIRKEMEGALLLGYPLDMDNVDAVILAAYELGRHEARKKHAKEMDFVFDLFGARQRD